MAKVTELSSGLGHELNSLAPETGLTLTLHCPTAPVGGLPYTVLDPCLGKAGILAPHSVVFIHLSVLSCLEGLHEIMYSFYVFSLQPLFIHLWVRVCKSKQGAHCVLRLGIQRVQGDRPWGLSSVGGGRMQCREIPTLQGMGG